MHMNSIIVALGFIFGIVSSASIPLNSLPLSKEAEDPHNVVHLDYGSFRGAVSNKVRRHLGIPYAHPPLGSLRFRPPKPIAPHNFTDIVSDATEFSKGCMQVKTPPPLYGVGLDRGENCLTVNVWTPEDALPLGNRSKPYPVMVWIYGGGYASGYTSLPIYNGADFLKKSGNRTIIVSFNYRVGIFGFLHSKELFAQGISNVGLLDQIEALKWVRKYIGQFGGDPNQITVFGESAGAISIGTLLLAGDGDLDLFDKAIMESGAPTPLFKTVSNSQNMFNLLALRTGCQNKTDVVECLRALPAETLVSHSDELQFGNIFYPVIDGTLLKRHPIESLDKQLFRKIPILLGTNTDEGTFFSRPYVRSHVEVEILVKTNLTFLIQDEYEVIEAMYNPFLFKQPFQAGANVIADYIFQCPVKSLAGAYTAAGLTVYKYHFDQKPILTKLLPNLNELGVFHFAEVPFVFGTKYFLAPLSGEEELSNIMNRAWVDFAVYGNPNGDSKNKTMSIAFPLFPGNESGNADLVQNMTVHWPTYTTTTQEQILFRVKNITIERDTYHFKECQFWNEVGKRRYGQVASLKIDGQIQGADEKPLPLSMAATAALGRIRKGNENERTRSGDLPQYPFLDLELWKKTTGL